jgi:hypothetical protein
MRTMPSDRSAHRPHTTNIRIPRERHHIEATDETYDVAYVPLTAQVPEGYSSAALLADSASAQRRVHGPNA